MQPTAGGAGAPQVPPPASDTAAPSWVAVSLEPAGSGDNSSSTSQQESATGRAFTPPPTEEAPRAASPAPQPAQAAPPGAAPAAALAPDSGTQHRSISIHADGSAHGGRRYFDGLMPTAPAAAPSGGTAAPGEAAGGAAGEQQADGATQRHQAIWVVEDGSRSGKGAARHSSKGASGTVPEPAPAPDGNARAPSLVCQCCGCPCGGGGGSQKGGSGGQQKGNFGNAKVLIEEPDDRKLFEWGTYFSSLPKKLKGGLDTRLPVPTWRDLFWSWLGAFLGILAVCSLNQWASPEVDIAFLVGSFGASAVLVFAMLESKMSQPRNFIGGQLLSAVVGITTRVVIHQTWIAGPVGMSLALLLMQLTSTTHPPGGATALIAATMGELPRWHGYSFLLTVLVGSLVMQAIALVVNNLDPRRRYPTYWV